LKTLPEYSKPSGQLFPDFCRFQTKKKTELFCEKMKFQNLSEGNLWYWTFSQNGFKMAFRKGH